MTMMLMMVSRQRNESMHTLVETYHSDRAASHEQEHEQDTQYKEINQYHHQQQY